MRSHRVKLIVLGLVLWTGCASAPEVVPDTLRAQVDPHLTFQQILAQPEAHRGKLTVLGGEVLHAKRLSTSTQLEILQLPLDSSARPSSIKAESKGRFFAFEPTFLDPATFLPGTRVTVVGELTGALTAQLDEMAYQYPTLTIKHLHVWNPEEEEQAQSSGLWYGIFGGGSTGGRVGGGISIGIGF